MAVGIVALIIAIPSCIVATRKIIGCLVRPPDVRKLRKSSSSAEVPIYVYLLLHDCVIIVSCSYSCLSLW